LKRHVLTVHQGIKEFACQQCKKSFGDARDLKRHLRTGYHQRIKELACHRTTETNMDGDGTENAPAAISILSNQMPCSSIISDIDQSDCSKPIYVFNLVDVKDEIDDDDN
jgi:hypothetical protein